MYPCFTERVTEEGVYLSNGTLLKANSVVIAIGDRTDLSFMPDEFLNERKQPVLNEFNQCVNVNNVFLPEIRSDRGFSVTVSVKAEVLL